MLNYRRNSSPTRQPPVASAFAGAAASPPPKPLSSSMAPPRFAPMGASASVDDGAKRRPFSSPSSLRAAAQAATELGVSKQRIRIAVSDIFCTQYSNAASSRRA
jgi:hypothetical protein